MGNQWQNGWTADLRYYNYDQLLLLILLYYYLKDLLDTMNTGKNARMSALEEQIAVEKNVEGMLSVRSDIMDVIKVSGRGISRYIGTPLH